MREWPAARHEDMRRPSSRPGVVSWSEDGTPLSLLAFTVADGQSTEITAVVDPAKLALMDLPDPV